MCLLITWIYFGLQPGIQQGTKLKCHRPERKFKKNNKKNQGLLWQISVWKCEGIGQQLAQGGLWPGTQGASCYYFSLLRRNILAQLAELPRWIFQAMQHYALKATICP